MIIFLVIVIIYVVRKKKSRKHTVAVSFTGNTDVNMYASPAYGTHQMFTEPGLDHLYEPIDELYEEENTTAQDTAPPADDKEVDAEGDLKITSSVEVVDQAVTKGNVGDTGSHSGNSKTNDEYVQAESGAKDHLSADEDDGYENDDQEKNDYLQLKADDEENTNLKKI